MSNPPFSSAPQPQPQPNDASAPENPSTMPPSPSLTLILAATPSLGIGKSGTLPWPSLKKEMGYFARVTKRVSPTPSSHGNGNGKRSVRTVNAVIMGRKTWDSIPGRFRPLGGRVNVVLTRGMGGMERERAGDDGDSDSGGVEGPMVCGGILDALRRLEDVNATQHEQQKEVQDRESSRQEDGEVQVSTGGGSSLVKGKENEKEGEVEKEKIEIDRIFIIGGATLYQTALELPQTKRILLTKIHNEYDCDTFFPVDLEESSVWRRVEGEKLREWTGEDGVDGVVEEKGVRFEFCMFERD